MLTISRAGGKYVRERFAVWMFEGLSLPLPYDGCWDRSQAGEGYGMEKEHIGFEIRTLSNLLQRKINQMVADEEDTLTVHQVWVLKFLVSRGEKETVQRDIEEKFSIRRSTASHMLTLMEHNGYIRRLPVPQDARMKRIVATEKGIEAHERMGDRLRRFEAMLREGMTDEELEEFLCMVRRFEQNIV